MIVSKFLPESKSREKNDSTTLRGISNLRCYFQYNKTGIRNNLSRERASATENPNLVTIYWRLPQLWSELIQYLAHKNCSIFKKNECQSASEVFRPADFGLKRCEKVFSKGVRPFDWILKIKYELNLVNSCPIKWFFSAKKKVPHISLKIFHIYVLVFFSWLKVCIWRKQDTKYKNMNVSVWRWSLLVPIRINMYSQGIRGRSYKLVNFSFDNPDQDLKRLNCNMENSFHIYPC
jgi:hypothetical protein